MIAHAFTFTATVLRLALAMLGLTGLPASALVHTAESLMVNTQHKESITIRQQQAQRCDLSSSAPNASGPAVAHDPGTTLPVVQMHGVDFRVTGDISFHVCQLTVQLVPHKPGQPIDMDDPGQLGIHTLGGEVTVPGESLDALFNRYLLGYSPHSLNAPSLTPDDGVLSVSEGLKLRNHFPGVWLPFGMRGTLALKESHFLIYTPIEARVMGIQTLTPLKRTGLELSQLAPLNRIGAKLDGNDMVLGQYAVFPPPRLIGQMKTARVTPDGLVLGFGPAPAIYTPAPTDAASRI